MLKHRQFSKCILAIFIDSKTSHQNVNYLDKSWQFCIFFRFFRKACHLTSNLLN